MASDTALLQRGGSDYSSSQGQGGYPSPAADDYGPEADWDVALAAGAWPAFTLYDAFSPGSSTALTSPLLGSGEPEIMCQSEAYIGTMGML